MIENNNKLCQICVNPIGLADGVNFHQTESGLVCEHCLDLGQILPPRSYFKEELDNFLSARKKVLFGFSGGLDSVIVLCFLKEECQKRDIDLEIFSILTGVKGRVAIENINKVIDYLELRDNLVFVDIREKVHDSDLILDIFAEPKKTIDLFLDCYRKMILPCGELCNSIMDAEYKRIMVEFGHDVLITGGDTPKKNENGQYSILWNKKSGISILRGAYAFGLGKNINRQYIVDNNIPWLDFKWGGYDTNCLIPGAFFRKKVCGKPDIGLVNTIKMFPIILDYLSERVRFGVIDREDALGQLKKIDIACDAAFSEFNLLL